ASNGSPSRNTCSPVWNGPMCSTSMCRSRSEDLSMPCDRQAWENAQVEQKVNSSPSSATMLGSIRGNAVPLTSGRTPGPGKGGPLACGPGPASDGAGEPGRAAFLRRGQLTGEVHCNLTPQQPPLRSGSVAVRFDPDQPVGHKRLGLVEGLGEVCGEVDPVAALQRGHGDHPLAHQRLDQLGAQHVVLFQAH